MMKTARASNVIAGYSLVTRAVMRLILISSASVLIATLVLVACSAPQNQNGQSNSGQPVSAQDWKAVEQALGKAGSIQPGDVYKVSLPRSDLKVTVGGVELKSALALGSWLAFKKNGDMTMVMGDLVLPRWSVFASNAVGVYEAGGSVLGAGTKFVLLSGIVTASL